MSVSIKVHAATAYSVEAEDEPSHRHQYSHVERRPCHSPEWGVVQIRQGLSTMGGDFTARIVLLIVHVSREPQRLAVQLGGVEMRCGDLRSGEPGVPPSLYLRVCHLVSGQCSSVCVDFRNSQIERRFGPSRAVKDILYRCHDFSQLGSFASHVSIYSRIVTAEWHGRGEMGNQHTNWPLARVGS